MNAKQIESIERLSKLIKEHRNNEEVIHLYNIDNNLSLEEKMAQHKIQLEEITNEINILKKLIKELKLEIFEANKLKAIKEMVFQKINKIK